MLRELFDANPSVDFERLAAFEKAHGLDLPREFKDFILKYNGGRPVPALFPIHGLAENPVGKIQAFFGLDAVVRSENFDTLMAELAGTIPVGLLPIGCTEGDDFVCIDMRHKTDRIVFWDRRPFWGTNIWNEDDLYPVARSFSDLLANLRDL